MGEQAIRHLATGPTGVPVAGCLVITGDRRHVRFTVDEEKVMAGAGVFVEQGVNQMVQQYLPGTKDPS